MPQIPLLIKTTTPVAPGKPYTWNKLADPRSNFQAIATPPVDLDVPEAVERLVTGVPTPFARARMFQDALQIADSKTDSGGLLSYYASLRSEWKGLITALALDSQGFSCERIELTQTPGESNIYEPKAALGRMLFESEPKWTEQTLDGSKVPFLQLLKYQGTVVAATHPDCILFTAAAYRLRQDGKAWIDAKSGRFAEPKPGMLSEDGLRKLYLYVAQMHAAMGQYERQFRDGAEVNMTTVSGVVDRWKTRLAEEARSRGIKVDGGVKPTVMLFAAPFDALLNCKNTLYGANGRFFASIEEAKKQLGDDAPVIEVELGDLLLEPSTTTLVEFAYSREEDVKRLGGHMLSVSDGGRTRLFSLPLSEQGLVVFENDLQDLLNNQPGAGSKLRASYDANSGALKVDFDIALLSGGRTTVSRTYPETQPEPKRIICWPDFVSESWNQYYLYSEIPHSRPEIAAFPIRADKKQFQFDKVEGKLPRLFENNQDLLQDDGCSLLVQYNEQVLGSARGIAYEIYQSNMPFKGVEFKVRNHHGGYVVFKQPGSENSKNVLKRVPANSSLKSFVLGVDFGSNNSCVSYSEQTQAGPSAPQLVTFRNRRRFLFGAEGQVESDAPVRQDEVFFFQAKETAGNTIKSMIMTHDDARIVGLANAPDNRAKPVKAGFPVFSKNIPVESADEGRLLVRMGAQPSTIRYNMKWGHDETEQAHKIGFLRMLLLKTSAELFADQGARVSRVVWAYPSAMTQQHQYDYQALWKDIASMESPLGDSAGITESAELPSEEGGREGTAMTEAEAVCRFATSSVTVAQEHIFVGLDVGGSTTDILCMVRGKSHTTNSLIREGSIRIAAGVLADATRQSKAFQAVIRTYCHSKEIRLAGVTLDPKDGLNAGTAPYYFNALLDRLDDPKQLEALYLSIKKDCPELVALNAYMTGLVMYHVGQIGTAVRAEQGKNEDEYGAPFSHLTIGCYGKGGRMFDWLPAIIGKAASDKFYSSCFKAGAGEEVAQHVKGVVIIPTDAKFVKAEVSFGLASPHSVQVVRGALKDPIGEHGIAFDGQSLSAADAIEARHLEHLGGRFTIDMSAPQLRSFVELYVQFMSTAFGIQLKPIIEQIPGMGVPAYIQNLTEYQRARRNPNGFDFKAPLFVLEGMCFLDKVLRPALKL
jgi:hypothetical protein